MYRAENKYALSDMDFFVLKRRMAAILPMDRSSTGNTAYKISSLYFDDIYDTHLRDTVDGNPIRKKFRIRIYNDSLDVIKLEVKYKCYNRIKKISAPISLENMKSLVNGISVDGDYPVENPLTEFNMAIKLYGLRPKIIVTYDRTAFIYGPGNVRITFDENLRWNSVPSMFGNPELIYNFPENRNFILEVKYDAFLPRFIAQALEINTMWQTAFSKYGICRQSM